MAVAPCETLVRMMTHVTRDEFTELLRDRLDRRIPADTGLDVARIADGIVLSLLANGYVLHHMHITLAGGRV